MSPKLLLATLDDDNLVTVRFQRRMPSRRWHRGRFRLVNEAGETTAINAVQPLHQLRDKASRYALHTAAGVDFIHSRWTLEVEGAGQAPLRMGRVLQNPRRFHDPHALLGARWTAKQTTFGVFAPTAARVQLVLANAVEGDHGLLARDMVPGDSGIWTLEVSGNLEGKFYAYRFSGPGFDPHREITDIYATCTQGRRARSMILDLSKTDPPGFRDQSPPPVSPADAIIYEMHVRDFTIADNSGANAKGKYLGLTEGGTHLPGDPTVYTGLDHLCELGVTHVQLMPVQDFDNAESDDDWYNWGYMPAHFNSPDGWYATSRDGPARIIELKQAIQALHTRGIGVILDVVYNHTSSRATFEQLVPDYYYRLTCRGRLSNGSGCGNEFRSESPMGRKFLLDSLAYWVREYCVDGFRFDLMALTDLDTMKAIKAKLEAIRPGILLYGEPWACAPTPLRPLTDHQHLRGTGIAAFNGCLRDAIKGDVNGPEPGYIQAGRRVHDIRYGLEGFIHLWKTDPIENVNYIECHDNLTAWDKLLLSMPDATDEVRKRMMRFAALILFTSQGITFVQAGQEFCRSKKGSHNSYNEPDEINRIDWSLKKTNADVWLYHRGMIAIRKSHPLLRLGTREAIRERISFVEPPNPKCVVCYLDGSDLAGESAEQMLIVLNGGDDPIAFVVPGDDWHVLADADEADAQPLTAAGDFAILPPHSGMLLAR